MSAVNTTNTSSSSSSTATVDTTYQLTDSLLPTGGFVCSSGLEAAAQHGWVYNDLDNRVCSVFRRELEDNSSSSQLIASQGSQHAEHMARQFLNGIRRGHVVGHLPVTFGISCAAMGLNLDRARHLFLFLYARNLFSSAVRLNLATEVMQQHAVRVQVSTETNGSIISATAQTAPLLDLYQGAHDRLYSRLFHS
ncbi:hypothetical protein BDF22DRAFT_675823 [Syncephalis plumigaleata]|nr:hypothetical protein BDF22DRAFT_675823 [Syncephalis plumigaleata]